MYANDTTVFFTNTSLDALFRVTNAEVIKIAAWFYDNKLCINLNKTNFLVFNSNDYNFCNPHQLVLNHVVLEHKDFTKFLGVLIDANLNRKAHIHNLSNRLTHNIALLKSLQHVFLNPSYGLYIRPFSIHLTYAIQFWSSTSSTAPQLVHILQNKLFE